MPSDNCTDAELAFSDMWNAVFERDITSEPFTIQPSSYGNFGFYCCSQFMVHRKRVHQRPRAWYQRVAESIPWEHCATSYMELLWHAIFNGGQLREEKRQERSDLPLFLRIDNFLETTSEGLV